jgi:hypothetical protein
MISTLSAAGKKSRRGSAKTAGVGVWFAPEAANVPPEASEIPAAAVGTAVFRFVSLIGRTVSPDHVLRQLATVNYPKFRGGLPVADSPASEV